MRGDLKVLARREPTSNEVLYMHPNTRILLIELAGTEYELAFENRGDTAFIAWLESAPTRQVIRVNPRQAMRHLQYSKPGNWVATSTHRLTGFLLGCGIRVGECVLSLPVAPWIMLAGWKRTFRWRIVC